jgi:hypothetical protein
MRWEKRARALAESLRDRLAEGGPRYAAELCCEVERRYGRAKLDQVLNEFMMLYNADHEACEAAKVRFH